ncbi:major outer membrane lipoprotein [Pantoea sp. Nvir]|uniref:major outer membrane lipoprotein n=1 Tax=Pantoea sp. Nvir TaxID=2576760 RepID=UPI0027E6C56B|nr:major outer membrane lipoprotein [Pantoea sp. Nvir]CAJ0991711.1 Major outer membrane lipoprotein Lpp 1 [Pantoea sp. Nvir]
MNHTKMALSVVLLSSTLLLGCSSDIKTQQLSSEVQTLYKKVDQLGTDMKSMSSNVQTAKGDAARANQRLDNQAHSYHK